MNYVKALIIFALGAAVGLVGGGVVGHKMGSTNRAIDSSPRAGIVEVGEERRPARRTEEPVQAVTEPVEQVSEAAQADPQDTAVEATPAAAGGKVEEFEITPNDNSEIMCVGYKSVLGTKISMEGGFANFEGSITVEDEDPDKSFVEVLIDMDMIFSENGILTTVLKGDQFFDVANFPQARFASTKIEPADTGYLITGNFTMKGVTQGIQFPAVIERRADGVFVSAQFTINRKQWNVGYDSYEDALVLEEVVITFEILAEPVK